MTLSRLVAWMGRVIIYLLLEPSTLWVNEIGDRVTFKCFPFMFLVLENIQFLCFKFGLISLYSFIVSSIISSGGMGLYILFL